MPQGHGVAAVLPLASSAREITGLQVAAAGATATVTMTAGVEGDSHALYFAWSNDGALDLSGVEITADNLEAKPRGGVAIVRAPSISGTPTSDVALSVSSRVVRIGLAGMRISIR